MLPITGPFTSETVSTQVGFYKLSIRYKNWYRQKRPYSLPLPYNYRHRITHRVSDWMYHLQADNTSGGISYWQAYSVDSLRYGDFGESRIVAYLAEAKNKAIAKFEARLSDTASTLTALMEAGKTMTMVERRLASLVDFAVKWRQGRYKQAIRVVLESQKFKSKKLERLRRRKLERLEAMPPKWHRSKTLASAWLETWMGWLPTIGDVQKGLEVLSRDIPMEHITARARVAFSTYDELIGTGRFLHDGYSYCTVSAVVQVTNPNLFLASQLGLTNPVLSVVETVKLSWLVGWFVNLDQFFRQYSVFHGVSVESPCHTVGIKDVSTSAYYGDFPPEPGTFSQTCNSFNRSQGLPGVTLQWKGINRLSATRGATLASLLTQMLPKG